MRARPYPSLPAGPPGGAPLLCGGVPPSAEGEGRRRTVQTPTGRQRLTRPGSDGGTPVGVSAVTAGSSEGERVGPRHAGPDVTEHGAIPGAPIFVDASGRRRKLARRASMAAMAVLAGYAGLLAVSFAGGPIPPKVLLPVPGIPSGKAQNPASSVNAAPSATGSNAGQPSAGGTEHRSDTRGTKPGESPGQSALSEPSSTAASGAAPPSPTGTTTETTPGNTHGNPTPPGHTRRKAPVPSQTS